MLAALVTVEFHIPASGSLKAKRGVIRSLIASLRQRLNVSVVEIAYQDLWQRSVLGVAVAAGSEVGARKVAQQVEKIVYSEPRVEIVAIHVEVVGMEG